MRPCAAPCAWESGPAKVEPPAVQRRLAGGNAVRNLDVAAPSQIPCPLAAKARLTITDILGAGCRDWIADRTRVFPKGGRVRAVRFL
jgi:hypothetical protein